MVGHHQRTNRPHRVYEQRVRPIEGVNKPGSGRTARLDGCPAAGLHRAGYFQGQFVEILFALIVRYLPFAHQAVQVAVGAQVVEAVVVHSDMAHVGRHVFYRVFATHLQKSGVVGGIVLQDGRAVLKTLRPLGPASGGVLTLHGEHRGAFGGVVVLLDVLNLFGRQFPQAGDLAQQVSGSELGVDLNHR